MTRYLMGDSSHSSPAYYDAVYVEEVSAQRMQMEEEVEKREKEIEKLERDTGY